MSASFARDEIVSTIEALGEDLQGDAMALAAVLQAIADRLRQPEDGDETPQYHLYEDSERGRMVADSDVSGTMAWSWMRDELIRLANTLRKTPEFYI